MACSWPKKSVFSDSDDCFRGFHCSRNDGVAIWVPGTTSSLCCRPCVSPAEVVTVLFSESVKKLIFPFRAYNVCVVRLDYLPITHLQLYLLSWIINTVVNE